MFSGMITLTESAANQVRAMREKLEDDAKLLRVFVEAGGCSGFEYGMSFDHRKEGDIEVESEGLKILVDPASAVYLDGCSVKFDDGLHGKGFEIINPNAQSTCGCGKSFS
jgi:iron-sulfur cluster assembly accessory protein